MPSTIPPLSFSKADILSAVETLAWSSLPVLADQAVQKLFFKNIPPNPKIDRTITGLITCAIIILYLPKGSPACIGAPCFYLAYRAALSYWNRKPTPPQTPRPHKPPASAPASKAVPPLPAKKPAATSVSAPMTASREGPPPALPGISSAAKPSEEKAAPPVAAQQEPPLPPLSKPSAAVPIPAGETSPSQEKSPATEAQEKKPEAEKKEPPPAIRKKINQAQQQADVLKQQVAHLDHEIRLNLRSFSAKVKITDLPQQEIKSESKEMITPKEPVVIDATFYINPRFVFKLPPEIILFAQKGTKKQYLITENTSFCRVFLCHTKKDPSIFPFEYFPLEILRPLVGKKKLTILKIVTEKQVFEIELLKASMTEIGTCLEKLDDSKKHTTIKPDALVAPLKGKRDIDEMRISIEAALTMDKCYLTPFEKK
ncbi:MAG: hypothetical protein JSS10_03525 [Verrucomicrobia bacterium]|nr:hypothetical protein [Verrucomicrobiota bacterium]